MAILITCATFITILPTAIFPQDVVTDRSEQIFHNQSRILFVLNVHIEREFLSNDCGMYYLMFVIDVLSGGRG